jgi:hypothetical protein
VEDSVFVSPHSSFLLPFSLSLRYSDFAQISSQPTLQTLVSLTQCPESELSFVFTAQTTMMRGEQVLTAFPLLSSAKKKELSVRIFSSLFSPLFFHLPFQLQP